MHGDHHTLPAEFDRCYRAESPPPFTQTCFFFGGSYVPPGKSDPSCHECEGWIWLRAAYAHHKERGGQGDIAAFYREHVTGNKFTEHARFMNKCAAQSPGW